MSCAGSCGWPIWIPRPWPTPPRDPCQQRRHLGTAETTGADFMLVDNGTIALEGGALRTPELRVMPGSVVVGHGDIAIGRHRQ